MPHSTPNPPLPPPTTTTTVCTLDNDNDRGHGKYDQANDVGANLFIGQLDPDVDEKMLYDTFSAFGFITQTPKVMRDPDTGMSKGYGFVSYDGCVVGVWVCVDAVGCFPWGVLFATCLAILLSSLLFVQQRLPVLLIVVAAASAAAEICVFWLSGSLAIWQV